jgi:hypothetical protein
MDRVPGDEFHGLSGGDRADAFGEDGTDMADLTVDDNQTLDIGTDERRMQVRAYNHWVSLLQDRAYPAIADLDPENIADFGAHSVLLDFSDGIDDPAIRFLGSALRQECDLDGSVSRISQVPGRSLLSRLTDHYLQIIANRAPIGFEAEFVSMRGLNTMYRGILMPFSSDNQTIDFIYGVINWKELADPATQAALDAEIAAAVRTAVPVPPPSAIWADGPSRGFEECEPKRDFEPKDVPAIPVGGPAVGFCAAEMAASLADRLLCARQCATELPHADPRSPLALNSALSRAYDVALAAAAAPESYAALLDEAGLAIPADAPMMPIVELVFGTDYDPSRLNDFAIVLSEARDRDIPIGGLSLFLDWAEGGVKGIVKAALAKRHQTAKPDVVQATQAQLRQRPTLASVAIPTRTMAGEYVVLLARANAGGRLDVIAAIDDNAALTSRALRHVAG